MLLVFEAKGHNNGLSTKKGSKRRPTLRAEQMIRFRKDRFAGSPRRYILSSLFDRPLMLTIF